MILPVVDQFTTFEFQKRGSLHTHTLLWLNDKEVPTVRTTNFKNRAQQERLQAYFGQIITS
ncbi:MAG: hypothetical protein MHMPM18_004002 [Marteilia pararefringens]